MIMIIDQRGGHNRHSFNKEFFKTWSDKMAYVLGFLVADGSITDANTSSRTQYVEFTNTKENEDYFYEWKPRIFRGAKGRTFNDN